ncbi:MAG: hypothetical protein KG003_02455 [Bacteroidetes bacterium]|nr:hypothetical protein [Bacteroidota bacterium]
MKNTCILLFSCLFVGNIFSQFSSDSLNKIAKDCTRERVLSVEGHKIHLRKGEVYSVGKFLEWAGEIADGFLFFKVGDDTLGFDLDKDSFYIQQLRESQRALLKHKDTSLKYQSIGPVINQKYKLIWTYILDFDTTGYGRCSGTGPFLNAIAGISDSIKNEGRNIFTFSDTGLIQLDCGCLANLAMYGIFRDKKTGEELKINTDKTIYYRSKKRPEWKKLISTFEPGYLNLSFAVNDKFSYNLYFTKSEWLLTPDNPGDKPQHFLRIE